MIEKRILWFTSVHHLNQFSQPVWCLRNEMLIKLSNCKVLRKLTANHFMAAILQKSKQFQITMNFQTPSTLTRKGPFLHAYTLLKTTFRLDVYLRVFPFSTECVHDNHPLCLNAISVGIQCSTGNIIQKISICAKVIFNAGLGFTVFIHWKVELQWGDPQ